MDLSRLPEPMRSRLREQLERLPPEVRASLEGKLANLPTEQLEAVLKKSAPMLERLAGKPPSKGGASVSGASSAGGKSVSSVSSGFSQAPKAAQRVYDPHDHYNNTVRRGDASSPPLFVILFLAVCAVVFLRALGYL
jgi:hypothetical protein